MSETGANLKESPQAGWLRLHCGDARTLTDIVPPESIDLVLTSPPYADLKDYGHPGQIGFGQSYDTYLQDLKHIFADCHNVCKPSGSMWIVVDTFKRNGALVQLPFEVSQQASQAGWKLQDVIIWHKTKTLPWSHQGRFRRIFEYILFFSKSRRYKYYPERIREIDGLKEWWSRYPERYNPRGRNPHNIWYFPIPTQGSWGNGAVRHSNPFPPLLVERIVTLTTDPDDVIMDPFAGTGTVLAQAACMGRKYVGFETNRSFVETLFPKVSKEVERLWLQRESGLLEAERKRLEFESLVARMRKIKYAKQLLRVVSSSTREDNKGSELSVECALALERELDRRKTTSPHKLWALDILIVVRDGVNPLPLEELARSASRRPPLSKFGVEAEIVVSPHTIARGHPMLRRIQGESNLWIYPATTDHWYQSCTTLTHWLHRVSAGNSSSYVCRGLAPLVSNIGVSREDVVSLSFQSLMT